MKYDVKKIISKLFLSLVAFIPCMWFGLVMNISMRYLGIESILSYIGLFVFYPLAYGMIWLHDRRKVVKYWCLFICLFAVISFLYFLLFVSTNNEIKYQFVQLFI